MSNDNQNQELAIAKAFVMAKSALDYIATQAKAHEPARKGFRERLDAMGEEGKAALVKAIPNYATCLPFVKTAMTARGVVIADLKGSIKARAKYIVYTVAVDTLAEFLGHAVPEPDTPEYTLAILAQYVASHRAKLNLDTVPESAKAAIDTLASLAKADTAG